MMWVFYHILRNFTDKCVMQRLFLFQSEDGIRDLVRSRGLGDVYKRQQEHRVLVDQVAVGPVVAHVHLDADVGGGGGEVPERVRAVAVQKRAGRAGVGAGAGDLYLINN